MNSGLLHTMQAFASSLPLRVLTPGEVLFEAGEPGDTIFCVLSGTIELGWGGDAPELFGPGDVLGVGQGPLEVCPSSPGGPSAAAVCWPCLASHRWPRRSRTLLLQLI